MVAQRRRRVRDTANELLAQRAAESSALLGSNLPIPNLDHDATDMIVDVDAHIDQPSAPDAETWDGISDALDPIRSLVTGPDALIDAATYDTYRTTTHRVVSHVSPRALQHAVGVLRRCGNRPRRPPMAAARSPPPHAVFDLDTHHRATPPSPHRGSPRLEASTTWQTHGSLSTSTTPPASNTNSCRVGYNAHSNK